MNHQPAAPERTPLPWWRRTYVVNRDLQGRFARSAVVIGGMSSAITVGILLWTFWAFNIWQGQRLPKPILAVIAFIFVFNCLAIYVSGILITQRITGPIYNIIRQFRRLAIPDWNALARFREDDELHYLAKSFNELVRSLSERDAAIAHKIQGALEQLTDKHPEQAILILQELHQQHLKERTTSHGL